MEDDVPMPEGRMRIQEAGEKDMTMRIEDITRENVKVLKKDELEALHFRCLQVYRKHFKQTDLERLAPADGGLSRREFLERYSLVKAELQDVPERTIDAEVAKARYGVKAQDLGDVVVVENYVSIAGSFAKDPRSAQDIDVIIRDSDDNRDEGLELKLGRLLAKEIGKDAHFVYAQRGPHSSYIPLFDLVLRPKGETKQVLVEERKIGKQGKEYFAQLDDWDESLLADNTAVAAKLADGSVLDIGCGTGRLLKLLERSGREVHGAERNEEALAYCKRRGLDVDKVDLEKGLPYKDGEFDNVIAVHSAEHVANLGRLADEAMRVAAKRAIFLMPLGKRADPTHEHMFKSVAEVQKALPAWKCDLVKESNSALAWIDRFEKSALRPFGKFTPPKPAMAGLTEAFSVEEISDWLKDRFPVDAEEKLNGFRVIAEGEGGRVRVKTEGGQDVTKQFATVVEKLKAIPDPFILDTSAGIDRDGKPLPRIRLMTLIAQKPELEEGDVIKLTSFDLPYWKDDIHEKPMSERRKALEEFYTKHLKGDPHFGITSYNVVNNRKELEAKFRKLGRLPQSEGIVIKTLGSKWETGGSAPDWAKIKHEAEIKVIALERHAVKGGRWNYTCGLLPGDAEFKNTREFNGKKYIDLGKCYNTELKAEPGDILTMGVEEIIAKDPDKLQWLGARMIDIDKDRKEPYFANQAKTIAENANVLQKAEAGNIDYEVGDKGRAVMQIHIMGIEEEKTKALKAASKRIISLRTDPRRLESALKAAIGEQGAHLDIRMVRSGDDYFEGGEIMIGNLSGIGKISKLKEGGTLRFGWKTPHKEEPQAETIRGPVSWMEAGARSVEVFPPGEAGATANKYGAMVAIDKFEWDAIEPQDRHAKKFDFKGCKVIPEGVYLMSYVPVTPAGERGERIWMIRHLKEEPKKDTVEKLHLEEFRADRTDKELKDPAKYHQQLQAGLRYLGNSGYPRLKAGEAWGDWKMEDILSYYAAIVDALRSVYYPIYPPKMGDPEYRTSFWQCYREAKPRMKSAPPSEDEVKDWEIKRKEIVKKLSDAARKECDEETEQIRESKKTVEFPHKFKAAKYTHPNGHPRCILCGQEERIDESCEKPIEKGLYFKFLKVDKKEQIVGGVIYEPRTVDTQGDSSTAEEIGQGMYHFMERYAENTKRIKIEHKGKIYFFPILECFQPEQDTRKGGEIVKAGSWWLMIRVTDKEIWTRVESGEIAGFSMGGTAKSGE
jgi:ATP-dependent DNA ligase